MDTRWIAPVALLSILLCSCRPSSRPEYQASQVKDPSERIKEISASQLRDWMATGRTLTLIDVREDDEWLAGHAATAIHISRWTLSGKIGAVVPDKTACIVLYCLGGVRSAVYAEILQKMGYANVYSLAGGFKNYQLAGLPIRK